MVGDFALDIPVTSTFCRRSLCSASDGSSLLERSRSRTSSQFLRAVATTGRWVCARSCWAKANPRPREAGVTRANPCADGSIATVLSGRKKPSMRVHFNMSFESDVIHRWKD